MLCQGSIEEQRENFDGYILPIIAIFVFSLTFTIDGQTFYTYLKDKMIYRMITTHHITKMPINIRICNLLMLYVYFAILMFSFVLL